MTRSPSRLRLASLALVTTALSAGTSRAETPEPAVTLRGDTSTLARNAMHGDVLGLGLGIDYEHFFSENLGLRVGYGAAIIFGASDANAAHGPHVAATLLLGDSSNFELSAGVGFLAANKLPPAGAELGNDWYVAPEIFVGYRYQQTDGGFLVRVGFGLTTGWGIGSAGIGYAW